MGIKLGFSTCLLNFRLEFECVALEWIGGIAVIVGLWTKIDLPLSFDEDAPRTYPIPVFEDADLTPQNFSELHRSRIHSIDGSLS